MVIEIRIKQAWYLQIWVRSGHAAKNCGVAQMLLARPELCLRGCKGGNFECKWLATGAQSNLETRALSIDANDVIGDSCLDAGLQILIEDDLTLGGDK